MLFMAIFLQRLMVVSILLTINWEVNPSPHGDGMVTV